MNMAIDILKTLVTTPVSFILLIAGLSFLFIAVGGKISGKIEPDKPGRFVSGIIGAILLVISLGAAESPQPIPGGTYQETCKNSQVEKENLNSICRNIKKEYNPTTLVNFKNCKGDIYNNDGKLGCDNQ